MNTKFSKMQFWIHFLFCIALSQNGWSSGPDPEEDIPDIARGHEEIYKPNPSSDVGKIEIPFASIVNPTTLEGTFDLRGCGYTGTYLSINTGYRKGLRAENSNKVETWIVPKFIVERDIGTTARHLAPIMDSFSSPLCLFWTWGGWDNMDWYDYLVGRNFDDVGSENLYENWKKSSQDERGGLWAEMYDVCDPDGSGWQRGGACGQLSSILIKM